MLKILATAIFTIQAILLSVGEISSTKTKYRKLKANDLHHGNRIIKIAALDEGLGSTGGFTIDMEQGVCNPGEEETPEPFFDSLLSVDVTNTSEFAVRFNKFNLRIKDLDGNTYVARDLSLSSIAEVDSKSTATFYALFLKAVDGHKELLGGQIPSQGFKNLTIVLKGRNFIGQKIKIRGRTAFSFTTVNRCLE